MEDEELETINMKNSLEECCYKWEEKNDNVSVE
jgi:hypothetical protein